MASEFRQAVFSPVIGYTRTNVELAKVLLRLGQPRDAAWWAELGEIAAMAWDAAGQIDSAAVRYRQVVHNWAGSEPAFAASWSGRSSAWRRWRSNRRRAGDSTAALARDLNHTLASALILR